MEMTKMISRIVLFPFNAAATSAEMFAQSTRSVKKMAEQSLDSVMKTMDSSCDECGDEKEA